MADIQINATGGDVTKQTSVQIRRGSTATDSPPVEDDVEQFSAHKREELTETGEYEDLSHYEDPVMHISGTGTLVFGGLDRRSFGGLLGGLGVFSDSNVRHFL